MIFLILYAAILIEVTVLVEVEYFGWSSLSLIAGAVGLYFLKSSLVLGFFRAYGVWIPAYVLAYVAIGVAWSFAKWGSYLMGFRRAFREARASYQNYLSSYEGTERINRPLTLEDHLRLHASDSKYRYAIQRLRKPRAQENKARIVAWTGFWPFSMVGTVLNDPIRRLCELSFDWFKGLYQRMSDRLFEKDTELQ